MDESPNFRSSQFAASTSGRSSSPPVRYLAAGVVGLALVWAVPLLLAAQVRVPEGMLVRLKFHADITTENVVKGDRVEFDVTENVTVNNRVVIPKGAVARGVVTDVKGAGKKRAKDAAVFFRLVAVRATDNQEIALRVMPTKPRKADASENVVEINIPIPGLRERMIGAEKGKDVAAYTDTDALVNAPEPATETTATGGTASGAQSRTTAAPAVQTPPPPVVFPPEDAYVDFNSNPVGADILINGTSRGSTPLRLEIPPGRHVIEIRLAGYRTWTRNMVVDPGSKPSVRATLEKE
ncbi:MAG: PEGA domain-containing protein [Terriglobia bacterium]